MAITKLRVPRIRIKLGPLEGWSPTQQVFDQMLPTTGIYLGDLQGNEIADLYNDTAPTTRDFIYWDYFQDPMTPDYNVGRLCYDLARGAISMPAGRIELLYTGDYDHEDAGDVVNKMEELLDEVYDPSPNCFDSWALPLHEFFEGATEYDILPESLHWSQPANWPIVPTGNEEPGYHLPQRRLTHDFFFNNLGQFASRNTTHRDDWADRCMTRANGLTYLTAGTTENQVRELLKKNDHLSYEEITNILANLPGIPPN